jgi:hypothetical protein
MKIQALVSYGVFLYACVAEICRQSIEPVLNRLLHFFIATHAGQKVFHVCEQMKIIWSQVQTEGRMGRGKPPRQSASATYKRFLFYGRHPLARRCITSDISKRLGENSPLLN